MSTKREEYYVAFQELAAVLLGLMAGFVLAYLCPPIVPAFVRYPLGLVVGWVWLASIPMRFIRRRPTGKEDGPDDVQLD